MNVYKQRGQVDTYPKLVNKTVCRHTHAHIHAHRFTHTHTYTNTYA